MLPLLIAVALAATATPPPDPAPEPPEDAATTLAELQHVYEQSCVNRAYGSFDDVCDQMGLRIAAYRRQVAHEARRRPMTAPVSLPPASTPQTTDGPATAPSR